MLFNNGQSGAVHEVHATMIYARILSLALLELFFLKSCLLYEMATSTRHTDRYLEVALRVPRI